jgi:hypothetical protein
MRDDAGQCVTERDPSLSLPPSPQTPQPPTHTHPSNITTRARRDRPTDAEFEAWWKVYPRKVEKTAARQAFAKAWAQIPDPDKLQILISAATAYAERTDPAFLKHPTTWLNKGCWSDEEPAPATVVTIHERINQANKPSARDARLGNMLSGALDALGQSTLQAVNRR